MTRSIKKGPFVDGVGAVLRDELHGRTSGAGDLRAAERAEFDRGYGYPRL